MTFTEFYQSTLLWVYNNPLATLFMAVILGYLLIQFVAGIVNALRGRQ